MKHRAKRRDANEPPIVQALENAGAFVQRLDDGQGTPDLLVGYAGRTYLLEVKLPLGPRGGAVGHQNLNDEQVEWHAGWHECGGTLLVVRTPDEALRAIGAA
jgi:hypothetical protein